MVTASDGSPTYATRKPLRAPARSPTTRAASPAAGTDQPWSWIRRPDTTALRPSMLATDRSISPVMMIRVIGSAISRIGAMSISRK